MRARQSGYRNEDSDGGKGKTFGRGRALGDSMNSAANRGIAQTSFLGDWNDRAR